MQKRTQSLWFVGLFIGIAAGLLTSASTSAHALSLRQVRTICGFQFPESIFRGKGYAAVSRTEWRRRICWLAFNATAMRCIFQGRPAVGDSPSAPSRKEACDVVLATNFSRVPGLKPSNYTFMRDPYQLYGGRGRAYSALGEYELAVKDLTKALQGGPGMFRNIFIPLWYSARALAYYSLARYGAALSDLDNSIAWSLTIRGALHPNEERALMSRGLDMHHLVTNNDPQLIDAIAAVFESTRDSEWRSKPKSKQIEERFRKELFGGSEMRGDIALAQKHYELALQHYDNYSKVFPEKPGLAEKIALTRKMMDLTKRGEPLPPSQPGSPSPLPPACKMYPNLC